MLARFERHALALFGAYVNKKGTEVKFTTRSCHICFEHLADILAMFGTVGAKSERAGESMHAEVRRMIASGTAKSGGRSAPHLRPRQILRTAVRRQALVSLETARVTAQLAQRLTERRSRRFGRPLAAAVQATLATDLACEVSLACADRAYWLPEFASRHGELAGASADGGADEDSTDDGRAEELAAGPRAAGASGDADGDDDEGELGVGGDGTDADAGRSGARLGPGDDEDDDSALSGIDVALGRAVDENGDAFLADGADDDDDDDDDDADTARSIGDDDDDDGSSAGDERVAAGESRACAAAAVAAARGWHEQGEEGTCSTVAAVRIVVASSPGSSLAAVGDITHGAMLAFARELADAQWPSTRGGRKAGAPAAAPSSFFASFFSADQGFSHEVAIMYLARVHTIPLVARPFRSASRGASASVLAVLSGASAAILIGGVPPNARHAVAVAKRGGEWILFDCARDSSVVLGNAESSAPVEWSNLAKITERVLVLLEAR